MKTNNPLGALAIVVIGLSVACTKNPATEPLSSAGNKNTASVSAGNLLVSINAGSIGKTVDSTMFGGVFEGHRLALSGRVLDALDSLKLTFLRYPGGTYAVSGYHYRDSEDDEGYAVGSCNTCPEDNVSSFDTEREIATRHTAFLDYCQSHNIIPQLIIPSDRYGLHGTDPNYAAGTAYAKNFLTDVNITPDANHPDVNHHAHAKVKYWNMGNEDYPASIDFNYGAMAKKYSNELVALDNYIKPTVNWKWNIPSDAANLAATLGTATYRGIFTNVLEPNLQYSEDQIVDLIQQGVNNFPAGKRDLQIGAWQANTETGWSWMHTASLFTNRFNTFVRAGATIACVWPLMTNAADRQGRLVNYAGTNPVSLAPCGKIFNWLHTSAQGKAVLSSITESTALQITGYRNVSNSTIVLFVCGMNAATDSRVEITLSNFNLQSATGEVLSEGPEVPMGSGVSNVANYRKITPSVDKVSKKIFFGINKLSQYEVARIIIKDTQ